MTSSWKDVLSEEKSKSYFKKILSDIEARRAAGHTVFPEKQHTFEAFKLTSFKDLSVVILGQDPYHGPGQAHGLCFSVRQGIRRPPSLVNIFKEIEADINVQMPETSELSSWARQGVLLLNTTLTVEQGKAGSHARLGWETFTDFVISSINKNKEGVVFLLWGAHARKKKNFIDTSKHHVLEAPHPSPLSAHRGFFGCRHFSKANEILQKQGRPEIRWAEL